MERSTIVQAAGLLVQARRSSPPLEALEEALRPTTIAEGHAIQDEIIAQLGESVPAWKVTGTRESEVARGAVLASRFYNTPAHIDPAMVPLLGVECEIAFRLDRALPPRAAEYSMADVAASVTALPAIEIVATRFASYKDTPVLHRLADLMSNGALVCGQPRPDWRRFDFSSIRVTLKTQDGVLAQVLGGHSAGDPLVPLVALANAWRRKNGMAAGQIFTTGTLTGLLFARPGDVVVAEFDDFGRVEVHFGG